MRKHIVDIRHKIIEQGKDSVTDEEKKLLVDSTEAAFICSALANREVSRDYIRQLIRVDPRAPKEPRLRPAKTVGVGVRQSHWYKLGELIALKWSKPHTRKENNIHAKSRF